jgi:ketosteroid isomerase-like protein
MSSQRIKFAGCILSFCVAAAASGALRAAEPPSAAHWSRAEASLADADLRRFRAMVSRDVAALSRLLADELVYVHSSSTRQSKTEHIHDTEVGRAVYRDIKVQEQEPRVYHMRTGVIQGIATFTTESDGHESTFTLRYTDVYILRDGRWQMVAWHCTRIPDHS